MFQTTAGTIFFFFISEVYSWDKLSCKQLYDLYLTYNTD